MEEFTADDLVQSISEIPRVQDMRWIHFEGRIPKVLQVAIPRLRELIPVCTFSLEIEKPDRRELLDLIPLIDIVFFSDTFYLHSGNETRSTFFKTMRERSPTAVFILTAGKDGAYCSIPGMDLHVPTTEVVVVDAIGAGDTFIAGYISCATKLGKAPLDCVKSAVALATKKVAQEGFDNLWT